MQVLADVRSSVTPAELERTGLPREKSRVLSERVNEVLARHRDRRTPKSQTETWLEFRKILETEDAFRRAFDAPLALYRLAYEGRRSKDGPGPAWIPSPEQVRGTNLAALMRDRRIGSFPDLHRWSVEQRTEFWSTMIERLGIVFRRKPDLVLDPKTDVTHPDWLPGAR